MATDYARSVQILVEIVGNPEQRLNNIIEKVSILDQKKGLVVGVSNSFNQLSENAGNVNNIINKNVSSIENFGKTGKNILGQLSKYTEDLINNFGRLATSVTAMLTGGAIAGFSYLASAQSKIVKEQILKSLEANKRLNLSAEEVMKAAETAKSIGYVGTTTAFLQTVNKASIGTKETGENLIRISDAASRLAFATQETVGVSAQEIVQNIGGTNLRPNFKKELADALQIAGVELRGGEKDPRLSSARGRQKLLLEAGEKLSAEGMNEEVAKRPWVAAEIAVDDLKKAIGTGLIPVMVPVIKGFTELVNIVTNIPLAPTLIGIVAILATIGGTIALLTTALAPINGITTALYGMAAAEAVALSPITLIVGGFLLLAGLLYTLESRTKIFSKAFNELANTELGKDAIQWFKDVGYWIDQVIGMMGNTIGSGFLIPLIQSLNSLYKNIKSMNLSEIFGSGLTVALTSTGPFGTMLNIIRNTLPNIQTGIDMVAETLKKIYDFFNDKWNTITNLVNYFKGGIASEKDLKRSFVSDLIYELSGVPGIGAFVESTGLPLEEYGKLIKTAEMFTPTTSGNSGTSTNNSSEGSGGSEGGGSGVLTSPDNPWGYNEENINRIKEAGYNPTKIYENRETGNRLAPHEMTRLTPEEKEKFKEVDYPNTSSSNTKDSGSSTKSGDSKSAVKNKNNSNNNTIETVKTIASETANIGNYGKNLETFASPTAEVGGQINSGGFIVLHSGEEVVPANIVKGGKTVLEKLVELMGPSTVTNNSGVVNNINIDYNAAPGSSSNMITVDRWGLEKLICDIIAKNIRLRNGY